MVRQSLFVLVRQSLFVSVTTLEEEKITENWIFLVSPSR
jgi:hypothetical protein